MELLGLHATYISLHALHSLFGALTGSCPEGIPVHVLSVSTIPDQQSLPPSPTHKKSYRYVHPVITGHMQVTIKRKWNNYLRMICTSLILCICFQ